MLKRIKERVVHWYKGEVQDNDESDYNIIVIGTRYKRHWTSDSIHKAVDPTIGYLKKNKEVILNGVIITIAVGAIVALIGWLLNLMLNSL